MLLVASAFREKIYIYLLHLAHHGTQCLFCSCFFRVRVANSHVAVRALHRSAGARSLGLMCRRLNGSADSPMQHDSVSSNLISKCARQQAASYKSKYHPSLCFRLQFINRWHLCVLAAVLQKSHGPLLRRISLLVITFARGLFRLLRTPVSKIRLPSANPQQSTPHNQQTSNCRYANLKLCKFPPAKKLNESFS
jgi:hypothetical protein